MRCICLLNLSITAANKQDLVHQERALDRLLEEAQSFNNVSAKWRSQALLGKAELRLREKNLPEALKLAKAARLSKHVCNEDVIKCFKEEIAILQQMKDHQEALLVAEKGMRVKTDTETNFKTIYRGAKKLAKIAKQLQELEDPGEQANAFEKMADIATKLQYTQVAKSYYKKAVKKAIEAKAVSDKVGDLFYSLALAHYELKEYESALKYFQKEMDVRFSQETAIKVIKCLVAMARPMQEVEVQFQRLLSEARRSSAITDDLERSMETLRENRDALVSDIDSVSDLSTDSDDEESGRTRNKRARICLKQDPLGETKLHKYCKKPNNATLIANTISRLGNVDIKDNSDFTPLHEACNYGYVEYVKLLHGAGANLERLAGANQERITPLSTACGNGHLDVIQYLLEQKVSVHIQDREGWFALDHLEDYLRRNEENMREEEIAHAKNLIGEMHEQLQAMKQRGENPRRIKKQPKSEALVVVEDEIVAEEVGAVSARKPLPPSPGVVGRGRRGEERHVPRGAVEYADVIGSLRPHKSKLGITNTSSHGKTSKTFVIAEEFDLRMDEEEWLEDDLMLNRRPTNKKPRKDPLKQVQIREKRREEIEITESPPPKDQIEVLDKVNETNFEPEEVESAKKAEDPAPIKGQTIRVTVTISDFPVLVPISNTATVADLAQEASKRYEHFKNAKPKLRLLTADGAAVIDQDKVMDVVNDSGQMKSEVLDWAALPHPHEIYVKSCQEIDICPSKSLEKALQAAHGSHKLTFSTVLRAGSKQMKPFFSSLRGTANLVEIAVPRVNLGDPGLHELCSSLPNSVRKLDLTCNSITSQGLTALANLSSESHLDSVILNFNPLFNVASEIVLNLLLQRDVRSLHMDSCFFTAGFITSQRTQWKKALNKSMILEDLSVQFNSLPEKDIEILVANVPPSCVVKRNSCTDNL